MSELAIVIVNYNSKDYLEGCLTHLYDGMSTSDFHTVVVDNASEDQEFSHLERLHPNLHFIQNESNLGFSKACNQGIRFRKADFYLFLNPDCFITNHAVDRALEFMRCHPEAGVLGGRVNNPDGTLQRACRRSIPRPRIAFYRFSGLSRLFPRSERFSAYNFSHQDPDSIHEVEAVSGSFLLFRHAVLETSGYMDEDFFLYGEDLDFCYRAGKAGWKVIYFPEAEVIHHKRVSSSRNAESSNFHFYDAMEIFYNKHFRGEASRIERIAVKLGIRLLYGLARIRQFLMDKTAVGSSK